MAKAGRAAALAVIVALLAACGSSGSDAQAPETTAPPAERDTVVLLTYDSTPSNRGGIFRQDDTPRSPCGTAGLTRQTDALYGFDPGKSITVTDDSGKIVDTGTLGMGHTEDLDTEANTFTCAWEVQVTLPGTGQFFQLKLGDQQLATIDADERVNGAVTAELET